MCIVYVVRRYELRFSLGEWAGWRNSRWRKFGDGGRVFATLTALMRKWESKTGSECMVHANLLSINKRGFNIQHPIPIFDDFDCVLYVLRSVHVLERSSARSWAFAVWSILEEMGTKQWARIYKLQFIALIGNLWWIFGLCTCAWMDVTILCIVRYMPWDRKCRPPGEHVQYRTYIYIAIGNFPCAKCKRTIENWAHRLIAFAHAQTETYPSSFNGQSSTRAQTISTWISFSASTHHHRRHNITIVIVMRCALKKVKSSQSWATHPTKHNKFWKLIMSPAPCSAIRVSSTEIQFHLERSQIQIKWHDFDMEKAFVSKFLNQLTSCTHEMGWSAGQSTSRIHITIMYLYCLVLVHWRPNTRNFA